MDQALLTVKTSTDFPRILQLQSFAIKKWILTYIKIEYDINIITT